MTQIENTGERILLEKETPLMIARHFCAYKFARSYVSGKRVLDIGCGEGYGIFYLADFAQEVKGIDYDSGAVNYAKDKYKKSNLYFEAMDVKNIGSISGRFDVISSFQCIEHITDTDAFLKDISALLDAGGVFICSTPNRNDASPKSDEPLNKFHIREYLLGEFRQILSNHFAVVDMFGLKRGIALNFCRRLKKIGLFNFLPSCIDPVKRFYVNIDCGNFVITKNNVDTALDFIAVCRKK